MFLPDLELELLLTFPQGRPVTTLLFPVIRIFSGQQPLPFVSAAAPTPGFHVQFSNVEGLGGANESAQTWLNNRVDANR
jgi:hypothetical protein